MKKKNLRNILSGFLLIGLVLLVAACGADGSKDSEDAQNDTEETDFPEKDIDIIVPFAPGGTTDLMARAISTFSEDYLPEGVSANVVNVEGGGGLVGMTELFNSNPDGYTIGMSSVGPLTLHPYTSDTVYGVDDFMPIAQVVGTPNIMLVEADAPWDTYEEWEEDIEDNQFTFGTSGAGNTQHITMEAFTSITGLEVEHVPFDGGNPAIVAMLGGHVDGALVQSTEATQHVESGEAKALFNTGTYKTEGLEDVPLLTEVGVDFHQDVFYGLVAPPETPDEIVAALDEIIKQTLEDEGLEDQFDKLGVPTTYKDSEDFRELILETAEINEEILEDIGLKK